MFSYDIRFTSPLEKIFQKKDCGNFGIISEVVGLKGETVSFQIAYRYNSDYVQMQQMKVGTKSPKLSISADACFPFHTRVRRVLPVPVTFPANTSFDYDYISTEAGLYPDILRDFDGDFFLIPYQWRSLWVDIDIPESAQSGDFRLDFHFEAPNGDDFTRSIKLHVINAVLPEQRLIHTEWFHPDCLANYYRIPVFSEEHWQIMEAFISVAAQRGCNMILTPLFTLPLDTYIGGERPTTQLVKVSRNNGIWSFDFSLLERWVGMCIRAGMKYFEMSHLFTQWGAKACPKIIVNVDGREEKLFGWHTEATSSEYVSFISAFLPALTEELEHLGIAGKTYFHVSDEPSPANVETYQKALELVSPYLRNYPIIDALSHVEFYKAGIVRLPIPTDDTFEEFEKAGFPHPWVYYCCSQDVGVPNRFMAMPSYRNRIVGLLFYRYGMEGFLHWGFNNYYSQYSIHEVDPYVETGAEDAFPAGDAFIVYPGKGGIPEESIRLMVLSEALSDLRACNLLEGLKGREYVLSLITDDVTAFTFSDYPRSAKWLLETRRKINTAIESAVSQN